MRHARVSLRACRAIQVKQTEQASIQAAFTLVGGVSGMYAPLYFTEHFYGSTRTGWAVIEFAFVGYAMFLVSS